MQQAAEHMAEGRVEEAVEIYASALVIAPHALEALRGRGWAYVRLKQWVLAAADFQAAHTVAPEDAESAVQLGMCLARDQQIYPAIEVLETLLKRQPTCVSAHIELGALYLGVGAIPKGRQCLQQALANRPTLVQRRMIETTLHEQDQLDRTRYYRPDFEGLQRQHHGVDVWNLLSPFRQFVQRFRRPKRDPHARQ